MPFPTTFYNMRFPARGRGAGLEYLGVSERSLKTAIPLQKWTSGIGHIKFEVFGFPGTREMLRAL